MKHFAPPRVKVLGAEVDAVTPREMLRLTEALVEAGGPAVIANHNAHSLALARRSAPMKAFYADADLVQIDSTPMILWARLLGLPVSHEHRSTYLDWREDFWRLASDKGWRVFYLGGAPGVAQAAGEAICRRWPGVAIGWRDGYFDAAAGSADNKALIKAIRRFRPDILFVGMGMPRQEEWIAAHKHQLDQGVIFSVGAAFDYEAGVQQTPPRWSGRLGVEWAFRLVSQPTRLAYRYLIEPWTLIPEAFADLGYALTHRLGRAGA